MVIYGARNVFTGRLYIGSTTQSMQMRKYKHENRAREMVQRPLYRDMRRLGMDSFEWFEIARCESESDGRALEAELIELLGTNTHGYNVARDGGCNRGGRSSLLARQKQSIKRKQYWATKIRLPMAPRRSWRPIMEGNRDAVLSMRTAGHSYKEIGLRFDCDPSTVCCAIQRWEQAGGES